MKKTINGKKVILRPLQQNDLPVRAKWTADRELGLLMGVTDEQELQELSAEDELQNNREWLERRHKCGAMPYAVEVNGRYIGDIDFGIYPNQRKADLTVFLGDRREWGKGYGTEAVELFIKEFFSDERIDFIEVEVAPQNNRALAFWHKLGFSEYLVDEQGTRLLRRFRGSKPIKIALASSRVGLSVEMNFLTVANAVKRVATEKNNLGCFPECALGGLFEIDDYQVARNLAIEIPGKMTERIAELAKTYSIYIAIGLLERDGPKLYDSAVLFSDTGEIILRYRRINPCWRAPNTPKDKYGEGREFSAVRTPFGKIGLAICGDTGDQAVVGLIHEVKPDFLIVPRSANFNDFSYNQQRWDSEKAVFCRQAVDIGATVFFVNAYSERNEGGDYGGSMVVSNQGQILRESKIGKPSILFYQQPSLHNMDSNESFRKVRSPNLFGSPFEKRGRGGFPSTS